MITDRRDEWRSTDLVMVGPEMGNMTAVGHDVMSKLEREYQGIIAAEVEAFTRVRKEIKRYVVERAPKAHPEAYRESVG
jgi:hypothetical protein